MPDILIRDVPPTLLRPSRPTPSTKGFRALNTCGECSLANAIDASG